MKKIWMILSVAVFAASLAGCTKCSPQKVKETLSGSEKPVAAVEDIGKTLAPVICEKYNSCNQNPDFNKEQCLAEIGTGISENLKSADLSKVTSSVLDACQKAITDAPCEALNSESPPVGCELLQ